MEQVNQMTQDNEYIKEIIPKFALHTSYWNEECC